MGVILIILSSKKNQMKNKQLRYAKFFAKKGTWEGSG
jgi:hypothetical protein